MPPCQDFGVILASSWYARMLGGELTDADEALRARLPAPLARLASGAGALRGLALHALSGPGGALVLTAGERGATTALVLSAFFGRRRVVLLELIAPPPSPSRWRRRAR